MGKHFAEETIILWLNETGGEQQRVQGEHPGRCTCSTLQRDQKITCFAWVA